MDNYSKREATILIIEDNPINLQIIGKMLKEKAFRIAIAKNGQGGVRLAKKLLPDLILLDIMMPGMDGFQVCKLLKANTSFKHTPILFITAKTDIQDVIQGFSVGGVDYITKPFNKEELLIRIQTHLDLKIARDRLEFQTKELKELNTMKDKLFSIIGHDLRSPLASVKMQLELMSRSKILSDKDDSSINVLLRTTDEVFNLLDNLLAWGKSQSRSLSIIPENVNLTTAVEYAKRLFEMHLAAKSITMTSHVPKEMMVFVDMNLLYTVLRNLLSNAIKFTPKGGNIIVRAKIVDTHTQISVCDTGIGISSENQKKLFGFKDHISARGTDQEEGTGLGLLLCKEFIEKSKGKIEVDSALGKGSTFTFTLPLATTE
jgi:two-component system sensor histidine kinase/response regulator